MFLIKKIITINTLNLVSITVFALFSSANETAHNMMIQNLMLWDIAKEMKVT